MMNVPPTSKNINNGRARNHSVVMTAVTGLLVCVILSCRKLFRWSMLWIPAVIVLQRIMVWRQGREDYALLQQVAVMRNSNKVRATNPTTTSATAEPLLNDQDWYRRYEEDYQFCSQNNNFVVDRYAKGKNIQPHVPSDAAARVFSLPPQAFQRHYAHDCSRVAELQSAIAHGTRKWINQSIDALSSDPALPDFVVKERHASYFVPFGCHVPLLDGRRTCEHLSKFAHVAFLGDSLQRQVYQGLVSGIAPDLQRGWVRLSKDQAMRDYCYCDGQYSEHPSCRKQDIKGMFHNLTMLATTEYCGQYSTEKIATTYMHEVMAPRRLYGGFSNLAHFDCSSNSDSSSGDMVLVLQGGLWFQSQATPTFQKARQMLKFPNILECARQRRLLVIWCSYNFNSPTVHHKYPHQSPANGTAFNTQMETMFSNMSRNLTIINWMNMTRAAQVSDGLHFLTDVNHFKAQQILLLADAMRREGMYYCDKEEDETCQ